MPASQLVSAQHGRVVEECGWRHCRTRCPDRYSCAPLYGAYGPWGGERYWASDAYTWGAGYYYTKQELLLQPAHCFAVRDCERPLALLPNEHIVPEHQNVHFGPQEAVKCFRRFADDGFIFVERGIENHWNIRQLTKRFYQRVKRSIGFF
jgi:hypothetical protein